MSPQVNSRAERVASELETEILTKNMEAGTRIGLRTDLIERFGVSPGVMNEALQLLRERNLISVKTGVKGGVFVAKRSPHLRLGAVDVWFHRLPFDPIDLFESRMLLENMFSVLAMERAGPKDLRAAEWALDEMYKLREDPAGFISAKMRFNLALARSSRVGMLASFYDGVVAVLNGGIAHVSFVPDHVPIIDQVLALHSEILDAIREQEPQRLYEAITLSRAEMSAYVQPTGLLGGRTPLAQATGDQ